MRFERSDQSPNKTFTQLTPQALYRLKKIVQWNPNRPLARRAYEFGYTKNSIANLMKISPQQMGQWIKEVHYEVQIHRLNQELDTIKQELISLGYQPQKALDYNDFKL